jgi:hypothetical protein
MGNQIKDNIREVQNQIITDHIKDSLLLLVRERQCRNHFGFWMDNMLQQKKCKISYQLKVIQYFHSKMIGA